MHYAHPDPALAAAVGRLLKTTSREKDPGKRARAIGEKAREMPGNRELHLRAAFHACLFLRKGGKEKMLRPETARQLKEAGLVWRPRPGDAFIPEKEFGEEVFITDGGREPEPEDVWLPDVEEMVGRIIGAGWDMFISFKGGECRIKLWKNGETGQAEARAEDFADLVGRALLFVLNMERGKGK